MWEIKSKHFDAFFSLRQLKSRKKEKEKWLKSSHYNRLLVSRFRISFDHILASFFFRICEHMKQIQMLQLKSCSKNTCNFHKRDAITIFSLHFLIRFRCCRHRGRCCCCYCSLYNSFFFFFLPNVSTNQLFSILLRVLRVRVFQLRSAIIRLFSIFNMTSHLSANKHIKIPIIKYSFHSFSFDINECLRDSIRYYLPKIAKN